MPPLVVVGIAIAAAAISSGIQIKQAKDQAKRNEQLAAEQKKEREVQKQEQAKQDKQQQETLGQEASGLQAAQASRSRQGSVLTGTRSGRSILGS